jgi:hypothetical protein
MIDQIFLHCRIREKLARLDGHVTSFQHFLVETETTAFVLRQGRD